STSPGYTQVVQTVALEPDPLDPSKTDLVGGGTSGDDVITITSVNQGQSLGVTVVESNGDQFQFQNTYNAAVARIIVFGGAGNDLIWVAANVPLPALLFGGAGDDVLFGGGGSNVLVGGP